MAVTNTTAALSGTVNPNGAQTVYAFQYGPTTGYGHQSPVPPAPAGSGTADVPANTALAGLVPGTTYHFRLIAISAAGTTTGADKTFTTSGTAPAPTTPPTATTGAATGITQSSATLNGTTNPKGQATSYWFEIGPTASYGFETAPVAAGAGTSDVAASSPIAGLAPGTPYHFRLVSESPGGTTLGNDQTFTTVGPPTVTTGTASGVTATAATLNGTVNPNGQSTSYFFQFGTSNSYGLQTAPGDAGSGAANVAVKGQLGALEPGTTYHYRLVGTSSAGTTYGADHTFKTTTAGPTISRVGLFGHTAFIAPQGVGGIFVGCIGPTPCTGSMTIIRSGVTMGSRKLFFVKANDGGIVHFTFSSLGERLLRQRHRLGVEVIIKENGGNTASKVVTLVPFT
jgi:hypothetical protein